MVMQAAQRDQQAPPGVLFDSSLNGEIDQILAVAMLFRAQAARRVRIASLTTGEFNLRKAAFLDAVARYYGGGSEGYGPGRRMLPVGMGTVGAETDSVSPMVAAVLGRRGADGRPAYPHTIQDVNDTADATAVIRNALTAFEDQNAVVVLAGVPANLLSFLDLPDGVGWAERKAQVLSIAGGRFEGDDPDPIIRADVAGFRRLLSNWPTTIVMAGAELNALELPGTFLEADPSDNPIADAYRAFAPEPGDAPTRALAATTYAIGAVPAQSVELSAPGTITVLDDGRTRFTPSSGGTHHVLTVTPGHEGALLQQYMTLLTETPSEER
jgi:hypothetical protein